jgi:hypothetical protein
MNAAEWTEELQGWYIPAHPIWEVIEDLRKAEERMAPRTPNTNPDLSLWD